MGTIEVDAARVVEAVCGGAKAEWVQAGESWLGPIENREREGREAWLPRV